MARENKIGIIVLDPVNSWNKTLEELIISTQFGCYQAVNLTKNNIYYINNQVYSESNDGKIMMITCDGYNIMTWSVNVTY